MSTSTFWQRQTHDIIILIRAPVLMYVIFTIRVIPHVTFRKPNRHLAFKPALGLALFSKTEFFP